MLSVKQETITIHHRPIEEPLDLSIRKELQEKNMSEKRNAAIDQATQTDMIWNKAESAIHKSNLQKKVHRYWEMSKLHVPIQQAISITDFQLTPRTLKFRVNFNNYFSNWREPEDCVEAPILLKQYLQVMADKYPKALNYILKKHSKLIDILY